MFSAVLEALKVAVDVVTGERRRSDEEREKFAKICDDIHDVLKGFVDASQDRRQSINLCARLSEYVKPIRALADDRLPSAEIDRLATALEGVCEAWRKLHGAAEAGAHQDEGDLDQLVKAQGTFEGMAGRLRAT